MVAITPMSTPAIRKKIAWRCLGGGQGTVALCSLLVILIFNVELRATDAFYSI